MAAYIVDRAQHVKDVPGRNGGMMQVIKLWLRDGDGQAPTEAEWFTRGDTPVPAAGSTIEGNLELDPQFGFKFKKTNRGGGGGQRGDLSPEAQARIDAVGRVKGRCHAQAVAMQAYGDTVAKLNQEQMGPFLNGPFKRLVNWLVTDAEAARDQKP